MSPMTQSELEAEIDRVNSEIQSLAKSTEYTYTVNGVTMRKSEALNELRAYRAELREQLSQVPTEEVSLGITEDAYPELD